MAVRHFSVSLFVALAVLLRCVHLSTIEIQLLRNTTGVSVDVKVEQGELRGVEEVSALHVKYFAFYGVPYAKPPVGDLRFRAPQPPEPWTEVFIANRSNVECIQKNMFDDTFVGIEDCLILNVYSNKLPQGSENDTLLPVMVWIHGGAFEGGSGSNMFYGPDFFMSQQVVIVSINYRLGALGFLNIKQSSVSANAGLKDQVAALKWIQRNIAQFGGDPKRVTIFGESAGGACVHYHILSPMSKGLFHRAISQSGSALNPWAFTKGDAAHKRAFKLAKTMGCDTSTMLASINCLKKASGSDLVKMSHNNTLSAEEERLGIRFPFIPSPEDDAEGDEEVFLSGEPIDLITAGNFNQEVPYITGVNDQETILFLPLFLKNDGLKIVQQEFDRVVPRDLIAASGKLLPKVAAKIKKFYFGDEGVSKETLTNLVNLTTDTYFVNGIYKTVKIQSELSRAPIYFYQFTFDGDFGLMKRILGFADMPGAVHGDELFYLFKNVFYEVDFTKNSSAVKTLSKMVKMWANFANTGDPSSEMDSIVKVKWTPAKPATMNYLQIDTTLSMQVGLENERIEFWEKLYGSFANNTFAQSDTDAVVAVNELAANDRDNEVTNAGNQFTAFSFLSLSILYLYRLCDA